MEFCGFWTVLFSKYLSLDIKKEFSFKALNIGEIEEQEKEIEEIVKEIKNIR